MNGSTQGRNLTSPIVFGVLGLIAILILGILVLVGLNRDIDQVLTVVAPTVVTLLGFVAVLSKTENVERVNSAQNDTIDTLHATTTNIAKRVNGELDAKFRNLNQRIDGLSNQVQLSNNLNVPATEISDNASPASETPNS